MDFDPAQLALSDRYKLLIGGVVPRPIAFVTTLSPQGAVNLAPFSFFNAISANPMTLLFCPANNADGSEKDTLRNLLATHTDSSAAEFVINIASERYERQVAGAAEALAYGESELALTGLESAPSCAVRPPRLALTPMAFECRVREIVRLAPGEPAGGNLVIGNVVSVYAEEGVVNERFHVDPTTLAAIGRMGGLGYARTRDCFEMPMGRPALELQ